MCGGLGAVMGAIVALAGDKSHEKWGFSVEKNFFKFVVDVWGFSYV
jgi:hypothetical protein